jgi:alpha-1,6-mannosyltransferase
VTRRSVHITNAWHGSSGGIRTFYQAMLAGAERHRRHMALVVPGERTTCDRLSAFTRVYSIRAPHSPVFDSRYRVLLPHRYVSWPTSAIARILAREQPDIVETCDKYALPFLNGLVKYHAGNASRPTLVGLSSERMDDNVRVWLGWGRLTAVATRAYLRRVYLPLFDGHIANSDYTAQELRAVIARYAATDWRLRRLEDRIHIGPMGVDIEGFHPARRSDAVRRQLLRSLGGDATSTLLLYAGRLSPEKHLLGLPSMLRSLVSSGLDARLVVCGDGPLRTELEQTARHEVPGRVRVLGHVARSVLARVLASADVFVHPNPHEPFGIGPLEAMASGLALVLPRSGGVLSYATDANSCLTPATTEGLAQGVRDVVTQPHVTAQRQRTALNDVRSWTWAAAVATYFDHYDAIDAARRSGLRAFGAPERERLLEPIS